MLYIILLKPYIFQFVAIFLVNNLKRLVCPTLLQGDFQKFTIPSWETANFCNLHSWIVGHLPHEQKNYERSEKIA